MAKIKIAQIIQSEFAPALAKVSSVEVPLKVAFRIKGMVIQVKQEVAKYEELRTELIKKHAPRNEAGEFQPDESGQIRPSAENMNEFLREMQELLNLEVEINTVEVAELGEKLKLTGNEVAALEGVLV